MAETETSTDTSKYFKAFDPENPTQDTFNYEAFLGDVKDTAAKTKQVTQVELPEIDSSVADDSRVQAAVNQFEASKETLQKQADNAARAIEMKGESVANTMKGINTISSNVTANQASASDLYAKAATAADDYVKNVAVRSQASLTKLQEVYDQMGKNRDFSQAHAMQAGVQATIGTMNQEGRSIAERYGSDSNEYKEWQQRKQTSLASLNSNITTSFQQFRETQDLSYLSAVNETMYKADQYASYADQTRAETLLNIANNSSSYNLQASGLQVSLETMKGTALEGMADYISESSVFTMDVQPIISLVADIMGEQEAKRQAQESEKMANAQLALQQDEAYKNSSAGKISSAKAWKSYIDTQWSALR